MGEVTLYQFHMSEPARAIGVFLKAAGIPHTRKEISMAKGEHKSPEYMKVNPFGKIPAISHDGFNLMESVAILKYLCATFKVDDHWYPSDLKKRAMVDAYMGWQHTTIRHNGNIIFMEYAYPMFWGGEYEDKAKAKQAKEDFNKCLTQLEEIFLKETPFVFSQTVSVADLLCVSEIMQVIACNYSVQTTHPKVYEYILRVRQEVGETLFDEIQKAPFETMGSKYLV